MPDADVIGKTEPLADGVLVAPRGEIDFSRSPGLRSELMSQLRDKKPKRMVIDLSAVPYMDSSGVATLVEAMKVQRGQNGKLILCSLHPRVRSIFEISRLDMVFTIVADKAAAEKA